MYTTDIESAVGLKHFRGAVSKLCAGAIPTAHAMQAFNPFELDPKASYT